MMPVDRINITKAYERGVHDGNLSERVSDIGN